MAGATLEARAGVTRALGARKLVTESWRLTLSSDRANQLSTRIIAFCAAANIADQQLMWSRLCERDGFRRARPDGSSFRRIRSLGSFLK
ncbi:hypothetical protein HYPDE_23488 [Hyphomicrobium denitrificans 1NES1]|uniref:Uncharacterized protein n=1 Tax=Hyphomicrobium denitrificans 1NES1 TaxID=670307 RepID=N0AZ27_9HYPH|nr:hypothetical protein HYPDE_23488 [Hyphomicrobium denitrificans 1NES1]